MCILKPFSLFSRRCAAAPGGAHTGGLRPHKACTPIGNKAHCCIAGENMPVAGRPSVLRQRAYTVTCHLVTRSLGDAQPTRRYRVASFCFKICGTETLGIFSCVNFDHKNHPKRTSATVIRLEPQGLVCTQTNGPQVKFWGSAQHTAPL